MPRAVVGVPQLEGLPEAPAPQPDWSFSDDDSGRKTVTPKILQTPSGNVVSYTATPSVVPDATGLSSIVVAQDLHKDIKVGDFAVVSYGGKSVNAIVGAIAPEKSLGGISRATAKGLQMPDTKGSKVLNVIRPGSAGKTLPQNARDLDKQAAAAWAGIKFGPPK